MKTNLILLTSFALALIAVAALWRQAENGRFVYHGAYVIDSRTGVVTKVNIR